ncbi:MAG TPA: hypothetical protein DEB40_11040 [Elusimicrobia bacterium]|nr:hypothetical protein [Elusimicrobiota bacterium]HBT62266.1 hypothetical protein [Elusimicrobiota bacterium]
MNHTDRAGSGIEADPALKGGVSAFSWTDKALRERGQPHPALKSLAAISALGLLLTGLCAMSHAAGRGPRPARAKPAPWRLYAQGSYEYDSNVLQLPETDASSLTGKSDTSWFGVIYSEYKYKPRRIGATHLRLLGLYQDYRKLNELDLAGASLGIQQDIDLRLSQARLRYDAQHFLLDRRSYLWSHGAALDADIIAARHWKWAAGYKLDIKRFVSAQHRGFEGLRHEATMTLERQSESILPRARAQAGGFRDDVRDRSFRHRGLQGSAELALKLPWNAELSLQPEVQSRWYDKTGVSGQPYRRELLQKYTVAMSRFFLGHVTVEASYSRIFNRATISRYSYKKWVSAGSLSLFF